MAYDVDDCVNPPWRQPKSPRLLSFVSSWVSRIFLAESFCVTFLLELQKILHVSNAHQTITTESQAGDSSRALRNPLFGGCDSGHVVHPKKGIKRARSENCQEKFQLPFFRDSTHFPKKITRSDMLTNWMVLHQNQIIK